MRIGILITIILAWAGVGFSAEQNIQNMSQDVSVIILLKMESKLDSTLSDAERMEYRQQIQSNSDQIVRDMRDSIRSHRKFITTPLLAAKVDIATLAKFRLHPLVGAIIRDIDLEPQSTLGTGDFIPQKTSLDIIHATEAQRAGYTGKGWNIAVIDVGINSDHPALQGKVVASCNESGCETTGNSKGKPDYDLSNRIESVCRNSSGIELALSNLKENYPAPYPEKLCRYIFSGFGSGGIPKYPPIGQDYACDYEQAHIGFRNYFITYQETLDQYKICISDGLITNRVPVAVNIDHGTGVAAVAAGNDFGSNYKGLASDAGIISISISGNKTFGWSDLLRGLEQVYILNKDLNYKIAAANVSLSRHIDYCSFGDMERDYYLEPKGDLIVGPQTLEGSIRSYIAISAAKEIANLLLTTNFGPPTPEGFLTSLVISAFQHFAYSVQSWEDAKYHDTKVHDLRNYDSNFDSIFINLKNLGIPIVSSSGNGGSTAFWDYPSCKSLQHSNVISVGAVDLNLQVTPYTNTYRNEVNPDIGVDFYAPGGDLKNGQGVQIADGTTGGYRFAEGTSYAAPMVAGAYAILREWSEKNNISMSLDQLTQRLKDTGTLLDDNRPGGTAKGIPLINIGKALSGTDVQVKNFQMPAGEILPNGTMRLLEGVSVSGIVTLQNLGSTTAFRHESEIKVFFSEDPDVNEKDTLLAVSSCVYQSYLNLGNCIYSLAPYGSPGSEKSAIVSFKIPATGKTADTPYWIGVCTVDSGLTSDQQLRCSGPIAVTISPLAANPPTPVLSALKNNNIIELSWNGEHRSDVTYEMWSYQREYNCSWTGQCSWTSYQWYKFDSRPATDYSYENGNLKYYINPSTNPNIQNVYMVSPCKTGGSCGIGSNIINDSMFIPVANPQLFSLTFSNSGDGKIELSTCPECKGTKWFPYGTTVALSAVTKDRSQFLGWGGACYGAAETCTVTMTADLNVVANFTASKYELNLSPGYGGYLVGNIIQPSAPQLTVYTECGRNGIYSGCNLLVEKNSKVYLSSVSDSIFINNGWYPSIPLFLEDTSGWIYTSTPACSIFDPMCTFTIKRDVSIYYARNPIAFHLNIIKPQNMVFGGQITSNSYPPTISCSDTENTCSSIETLYGYTSNTTLTATPNDGYLFSHWEGDCSGTANTFSLTSWNFNMQCKPVFVLATDTDMDGMPNIWETAHGLNPNDPKDAMYDPDGDGIPNYLEYLLGTDPNVADYSIKVFYSGPGIGDVSSMPEGITAGVSYSKLYSRNTQVVLAALPALDSIFAGWSGACSGTGTCTVTMDSAKTVTALFVPAISKWPMRQHDMHNTGRADYSIPSNRLNDTFFDAVLWQKPALGALSSSTMSYFDGTGPNGADIIVSGYHWPKGVQGMDRHTGKKFWTGNTSGGESIGVITPAFSPNGQTIYVTNDNTVGPTPLMAFNSAIGPSSYWHNGADPNPLQMGAFSPTTASDGRIFLPEWNQRPRAAADSGTALTEVWSADKSFFEINSRPALYHDGAKLKVIAGGRSGLIKAFDGGIVGTNELWSVNAGVMIDADPTVDPANGHIYVSAGESSIYVIGLDANGNNLWSSSKLPVYTYAAGTNEAQRAQAAGCLSYDGATYYFQTNGSSGNGMLYAINTSDGSIKWTYNTGSKGWEMVASSPIVFFNGVIVVGNNDGGKYFALKDDGTQATLLDTLQVDSTGNARSSATVAPDGRMYLPLKTVWKIGNGDGDSPTNQVTNVFTAFDISREGGARNTLTVNVVGTGSVTPNSGTLSWNGNSGTDSYLVGDSVTLTATATAGSGYAFTGWNGGGCSGIGICTVVMDSAKNVTATFSNDQELIVSIAGSGAGTVTSNIQGSNPACASFTSGACVSKFSYNAAISLLQTPSTLSTFGGWNGCGSMGVNGECNVTMTGPKSVTASFTLAPKAKIGSTGYTSLLTAYTAADSSATILALDTEFIENLFMNGGKAIVLKGGYKADYSGKSGLPSYLKGVLTIGTGSLTVEGVAIH